MLPSFTLSRVLPLPPRCLLFLVKSFPSEGFAVWPSPCSASHFLAPTLSPKHPSNWANLLHSVDGDRIASLLIVLSSAALLWVSRFADPFPWQSRQPCIDKLPPRGRYPRYPSGLQDGTRRNLLCLLGSSPLDGSWNADQLNPWYVVFKLGPRAAAAAARGRISEHSLSDRACRLVRRVRCMQKR